MNTGNRKCILVTGGAGFIGCAISGMLADTGLPVVVLDNLHPQVHSTQVRPSSLDDRCELVVGDVCNKDDWDRLLSDWHPEVIVHLAAETGTGQSLTEGTRHAAVNVVGTTQMLDAIASSGRFPKRIVLSSSRAVYGEGAWRDPEGRKVYPGQRSKSMLDAGRWDFEGLDSLPFEASSTRAGPTSIYGSTKLAQEHILQSWCESFGVELAVLRLQNVYGPGQSLTNPYTGIVPLFGRIAKAGDSIPLYEDGEMKRDFVFISDVANAIAIAANVDVPLPAGVVDIGTGKAISISQLAEIVRHHYGSPKSHVTGKFRHGDVRHAACMIHEGALDAWKPTVPVERGVVELCRWIDESE